MQELADWLDAQFQSRHVDARVHRDLIRQDNNWYYVPVYVDMRDAYDKATLLQQIEDDWQQQQPLQGGNLLLVPAAN